MSDGSIDAFPVTGKRRVLPWIAPLLAAMPQAAPRRFQAFSVGLPRSGTRSLASLFEKEFRAAHEPMAGPTIDFAVEYARGRLSAATAKRLLRARDKRLSLEMEASHFLHLVIDLLPALFSRARFILTYREPIAWFRSEVAQEHRTQGVRAYDRLAAYRYGRFGLDRPAVEREVIASPRVYPFANYFLYWASHLKSVLDAAPPERLLVLPTERLTASADALAAFVGRRAEELDQHRGHQNKSRDYPIDPERTLPEGYLEQMCLEHCDPVMRRLQAVVAAPSSP